MEEEVISRGTHLDISLWLWVWGWFPDPANVSFPHCCMQADAYECGGRVLRAPPFLFSSWLQILWCAGTSLSEWQRKMWVGSLLARFSHSWLPCLSLQQKQERNTCQLLLYIDAEYATLGFTLLAVSALGIIIPIVWLVLSHIQLVLGVPPVSMFRDHPW